MLNLLIKTAIVYFSVMLLMRVMGKRQLAQLETFDLVIALLISEIASVPLDSPEKPLLQGIMPALLLVVLYFITARLSMKSRKFASLVEGSPAVIVKDGVILKDVMQRSNYSVSDLTEALRLKGYDDIALLDCVILETSGHISAFPKKSESAITPFDLDIKAKKQPLSLPLVILGQLQKNNIAICGMEENDLLSVIAKNCSGGLKDIFYAARTRGDILFVQFENGKQKRIKIK